MCSREVHPGTSEEGAMSPQYVPTCPWQRVVPKTFLFSWLCDVSDLLLCGHQSAHKHIIALLENGSVSCVKNISAVKWRGGSRRALSQRLVNPEPKTAAVLGSWGPLTPGSATFLPHRRCWMIRTYAGVSGQVTTRARLG